MDLNFFAKWASFWMFFLSAIIHVMFFVLESILYQRKGGNKYFKVKSADHIASKVWALNQGFYNLFLALQMFVGLYFVRQLRPEIAGILVGLSGAWMILAGVVLFFSAPQLRRGALVQALPPIFGFVFLMSHILR